ncbi:MAG TPA: hypothetical protein VFJ66_08455, partial [Gaiellales bacterium]|nr:hypothetical protein [Gaiellales bacterium]
MTAADARLRELAASTSVEVTPRHAAELAPGVLSAGTSVYITALPGADLENLVTGAAAIRAAGYSPVP